MARTPLLTRFQQLFEDFAEAERSHRSIEQVQRERTFTRRQVLKAGGMLAAGAALGPQLHAFAGSSPFQGSIAIVGAGIAGLNAALTLRDAGIPPDRITLYEASDRVGGRMHSGTTAWLNGQMVPWANGQTAEHCGELIDSKHKTILGLAMRYKLPTVDLLAAEPPQSTETYFFSGSYYPRAQATADFKAVYSAVKKDLISAPFPTLFTTTAPAAVALDKMSLYQWIETRVPGGHTSRMGQLLDVAYNIEYGNITQEQSSLNLVYLLGFQPIPGNFRIFGASDERYHIEGGNERLPAAIADDLRTGTPAVDINLNTALTSIAMTGSNGPFLLMFKSGKTTTQASYTRVILALPFSVLRNLNYSQAGFDSLKTTAITQLAYGKNCKLQLQFNSRLWNTQGPWGLSTGTTYAPSYQNTWDVTRGQVGATGILVDYTGGGVPLASFKGNPNDPKVVARFAQTFLKQIEPVFPGITGLWNGGATLDVPLTNPFLLGSYSYWKPGQYTLFSGYEGARQPNPFPPDQNPKTGKCHFAGEHCSTNFQGFMEGGAEEGARAANEILSDLKAGIVT